VSLRSRLVAGFIAVALVLIAADAVVAVLVHRALLHTVDRRLEVARGPRIPGGAPPGVAPSRPDRLTGVTDLYVVFVSQDGTTTRRFPNSPHAQPPPAVPTNLASRAAPPGTTPTPFTAGQEGGGGDGYRAVAFQQDRGVVFIAVSLHDTVQTFQQVLVVEVIATLVVLAALGVVAWFVLHLGLRPIDRMAETADAIAAGDLSRRVERAEPSTEAGRLGLAFNTMLNEIEEAFAERHASEDRLRRFVADASHELRTPLTSIRGYAELWRQGGLVTDTAVADAMRRIEQEAARMGVLVDDLLLLARLDQGRPLDSRPTDLAALALDAVSDARAVEPDRPISLDAPDHLVVPGDEDRLRQVIANLLANARSHTPAGTPVRVRVTTEGSLVVLEVEDDGPGFGPGTERVFERFYRTDPARARASGGSGLGLSIVAAVVEAHGGRAIAGSSASGGARVRVELPLTADAATSAPAPTAPAPDTHAQFA